MISEGESALSIFSKLGASWKRRSPLPEVSILLVVVFVTLTSAYLVDWNTAHFNTIITNWPLFSALAVIFFLSGAIIQILWYFSVKPRRVSTSKIGLLFAIETENQVQKKRIVTHFVRDFTNIVLRNTNHEYTIQFVSEYFTEKVCSDNGSYARNLLEKVNGNLLLYGRIEERKRNGTDVYVLTLSECVRHRPIAIRESTFFGLEMRRVIPFETFFAISDEYNGFSLTSRVFGLGSKYVLGLAAFYSDSLALSYNLLTATQRLCDDTIKVDANDLSAKQIVSRLPIVIGRVCERASILKTVHERDFRSGLDWATKAITEDINNYGARLCSSTCNFKLGNYDAAVRDIEIASNNKQDFTWAWSKAFLLAYRGDLQGAYDLYKTVVQKPAVQNAAIQCEIFISEVLDAEPSLFQLYYCLGLINYLAKEDWILASEFFELFIAGSKRTKQFNSFVVYAEKMRATAVEKIKLKSEH